MINVKKTLHVGMIGSGFMGKCHANAFRAFGGLFDSPISIELYKIADINDELAAQSARTLGFEHSTSDWKALVDDPLVDIVSIAAPNALHEEIALRAIDRGKTVYCEKPLSVSTESARKMMLAVEAAGVANLVGFNFLRNPLIAVCRDMIASGKLGEIISFKGRHAENYMLNESLPHSFRTDPAGGGAVADIGSHIVSMARYLLGGISEVTARSRTIHRSRPVTLGSAELAPVEVDDLAHAILQFDSGVVGSIDVNWMSTGRSMDLSFEVTGTRGAVSFSQERMNELHIWEAGKSAGYGGFKKIETGPDHPPYGNFCPAAGHHLGFNDLKVIEVSELIDTVLTGKSNFTDFREGYRVQCAIDAILRSTKSGHWEKVAGD
jgi:predicted dehydrogenase